MEHAEGAASPEPLTGHDGPDGPDGHADAEEAEDPSVRHLLDRLAVVEGRVRDGVAHRRASVTAEADERFRGLFVSELRVDALLAAGPQLPIACSSALEGSRASSRRSRRRPTAMKPPGRISACVTWPRPSTWPPWTWNCCKLFKRFVARLTASFDVELAKRKSLTYADLAARGWNSAEGVVDSQITQKFTLATMQPVGKPLVASKSLLTRAAKGSATSVESLDRFGTYANLLKAGAFLRIKLAATGCKDITLEFDPTVAYPKALERSTEQLVAWLPIAEGNVLKGLANSDDLERSAQTYLDKLFRSRIAA